MTLLERLQQLVTEPSDIQGHLVTLYSLAMRATHITEFGVRTGRSTIALLAGLACRAKFHDCRLVSYDVNPADLDTLPPLPPRLTWQFVRADTATVQIEPTDLLFIDTYHTAAQVAAELTNATRVRKLLVFHDTTLFGWGGVKTEMDARASIERFSSFLFRRKGAIGVCSPTTHTVTGSWSWNALHEAVARRISSKSAG